MIPLSVSAVVVGLGIVVGVLRWYPDLFRFPYLPALPHIMLVLPFVIRLLVPAMERINELYAQQANLLQMSSVQRWWHSRGAFLVPTMTMAASLCLAFSLGEFGASFLVVRVGSWDTLSVMVDTVAGRPKFDPMVIPTAMALASMLMLLTFIILGLNERLRTRGGTDDV
jgi:thiamine transport system permease protein